LDNLGSLTPNLTFPWLILSSRSPYSRRWMYPHTCWSSPWPKTFDTYYLDVRRFHTLKINYSCIYKVHSVYDFQKHPRFYKPNIGLDPLDQGWASILIELSYQLKFQQRYVEILVIKSLFLKNI
jgi:hypothetical protein